jgi:O-antigen/teichoic acid export membrane protein
MNLAFGSRGLSARAIVTVGAYIASALVAVGAVYLAKRTLAPEPLRAFLSYLVILAISAGLEPGTTKAHAVAHGADAPFSARQTALTSLLKAIVAAAPLAVIWSLSDPALSWPILALTPLICAVGFVVSDLRVRFDLEQRHVMAVWLKQGSTATGVLAAAVMMALGGTAFASILVATLVRVLFILGPLREPRPGAAPGMDVRGLITATPWQALAGASVLAAAGGSMDRLIAVRVVNPSDLSSYYLIFEILSKFWLLPYLLTPILFAQRVARQRDVRFERIAFGLTGVAGALFLGALVLLIVFDPSLSRGFTGRNLDVATLALAGAIVLSSFTQLINTQQQAAGRGRRVIWVLGISLGVGLIAFAWAAPRYGIEGLMWAWLVRMAVEFVCAWAARVLP